MGPEFIRVLDEPLVVLELPGSIVVSTGPDILGDLLSRTHNTTILLNVFTQVQF